MAVVLVAGATGVLGRAVTARLVAAGHEVTGITRSAGGATALHEVGATALVGDVYHRPWVLDVVRALAPAVIVNELTDLPDDVAEVPGHLAANARIRRVGTRHLLDAAAIAGTERFVTQSVAWALRGDGGRAVDEMEAMVLDAGGVVVRYGQLHGPGTYHPAAPPDPPRVHVDDAARRTLAALTGPSRILTVVDDAGGARPT